MTLVETLNGMSGKDLVEVFNEVCEEGSEVKKFRSKDAGVKALVNGFDEESLMAHLKARIVVEDDEDETAEEPEDKKTRRNRHTLADDAVLKVLSTDTRSRCALDIIAAIEKLGEKATVVKVIEVVCKTHVAPRSLSEDKPGFVRGYVTDMIRRDFLEVE